MTLPFEPPIEPMLARLQPELPAGRGWLYEPKWDGFRAVVFRDGPSIRIGSRNGQELARYFPELVEALRQALPSRAVVDGEIVVGGATGLDFDALLQRIHPAESRIRRLAAETPASIVLFDLLALGGTDLRKVPLTRRRAMLDAALRPHPRVLLTPQTTDPEVARGWFTRLEAAGLDGVVAKRAELPYIEGERVMVKVKHERTADVVVGGYRPTQDGTGVASLLLGLHDDHGVLHHVGHTSAFTTPVRRKLLRELAALEGGVSFGEGRTPGTPSRWSQGRDTSWVPVTPSRVCEVRYDHLQGDRFRHAVRFLRWRPDRDPRSCTYAQLQPPEPVSLETLSELPGA